MHSSKRSNNFSLRRVLSESTTRGAHGWQTGGSRHGGSQSIPELRTAIELEGTFPLIKSLSQNARKGSIEKANVEKMWLKCPYVTRDGERPRVGLTVATRCLTGPRALCRALVMFFTIFLHYGSDEGYKNINITIPPLRYI